MRMLNVCTPNNGVANVYSPVSARHGVHRLPPFRSLTTADIPSIKKYIADNPWRTCDYTVGGIFMWLDYFDYEFCIYRDTLFIKGESENNRGNTAFSLPLGELPLNESATLLADYCASAGRRLEFSAIPESMAVELAGVTGGRLEMLDGWSDYLYDASALATLSGKVYSKKRNHVNRFLADNPDYRFEAVGVSNVAEVRQFMLGVDLSDKSDVDTAAYELSQCIDVVDNLGAYGFEGALLRDNNGRVCAVTFGEVVGDTLYVHIEKMDHDIAGAGETINKLFAGSMTEKYPQIRFINREEDMGDEGLRYAKNSYHPVSLLKKYNVIV